MKLSKRSLKTKKGVKKVKEKLISKKGFIYRKEDGTMVIRITKRAIKITSVIVGILFLFYANNQGNLPFGIVIFLIILILAYFSD